MKRYLGIPVFERYATFDWFNIVTFLIIFSVLMLVGCSSLTTNSWQYNKCFDPTNKNDVECYDKRLGH